MRARTPRRAAMLVTAGALCASMISVPTGAVADHSAPLADREWISQAGGAQEREFQPLIENFNVLSVLFHAKRFPFQNGAQRDGSTRYMAWGLVKVPDVLHDTVVSQLAVSRSDDGFQWGVPELASIRDPDGVDVPFILNEPGAFFDVVFTPTPVDPGFPAAQFSIYYRTFDGPINNLSSIHYAFSDFGRLWYLDRAIGQNAAEPVLKAGTFKDGSHGPTDVIYQPTKSNAAACATVDPDGAGPLLPSPWNCRLVMLYDVTLGSVQQVGIASAPDLVIVPNSTVSFRGHPSPLVPAGAADEWDDDAATIAKVRIRPNTVDPTLPHYDLYYSGGRAPDDACFDGKAGCWSLGSATSTGLQQGLAFTKTVGNPVTPHELLEVFANPDPHTLWAPSVVDDAGQDGNGKGHARIFYTRITAGDLDPDPITGPLVERRDMFVAYTSPAPGQGPQIRISNPVGPFRNRSDTPIEFYLTDTLGTPGLIGVNMATLVVTIDGTIPVLGYNIEFPHLVTALKFPAHKVTKEPGLTILADGPHTFTVSVADLQGNVTTLTTNFIVDTTPPDTKITSSPAPGPVLGFPLDSIGTFKGRTTDVGTGNLRLDVRVTNVLGMSKTYQIQDRPNGPIIKVSDKIWDWTWVAPTPDPQFLIPGPYTISVLGMDIAFNQEKPDADNTVTVLVI